MGLHISVFRAVAFPDCTNNGVSSRYANLCLVNANGPFDPDDRHPPVLLHQHHLGCLRIVPAVLNDAGQWVTAPGHFMAGGNFGHTSDSRFSDLCESMLGNIFYGAVAIHDRQE